MCKFRLQVEQCGCNDVECKQINPEIQDHKYENLETGGHIIRVTEYYRTSGVCLGWFINEDPNRLMVRYGMDPDNGNSKVDCPEKEFVFDEKRFFSDEICEVCQKTCTQPPDRNKTTKRGKKAK